MKVTLESTEKVVHLNGVPARIWEGHTENGIAVHAYITRIACDKTANAEEFERDLKEQKAPSAELQSIPLRMII